MKNKIIGILVVMLLIATVLPVLGSTEKVELPMSIGGGNLAPNPSFEEGYGDTPYGWAYEDMGDETVTFHWDSSYAHTGDKSVGIADVKSFGYSYYWHTVDFIPIDQTSESYYYSIWYKYIGEPSEDERAYLYFAEYDINKRPIGGFGFMLSYENDENWHNFEYFCNDWFSMTTDFVRLRLVYEVINPTENPPSSEVRFDDVFFGTKENNPPTKPILIGPVFPEVGENCEYKAVSWDLDGDELYYCFTWKPGYDTGWLGPYDPGETCTASHIWDEKGVYTLTVRAKDSQDAESEITKLKIIVPKTHSLLDLNLFERLANTLVMLFVKEIGRMIKNFEGKA